MLKRNVTILLLLLLVPCFMMGQALKVSHKVHKVVGTENTNVSANYNKTAKLLGTPFGEQIGLTTNYDSWTNCIVRDQIIYADGVKLANMVKPFPNVTGDPATRHIVYSQKDVTTGAWSHFDVFGGAAGWPDIDVSRTGANLGTIGIVGHSPNRLAIWDGTSSFLVTAFAPATDPSLQFAGDNMWLATSGNVSRDQFQFFKSSDGATFDNWDSISAFKSNLFWQFNGSVELGISKSADETQLVYYGQSANNTANNVWFDAFDGVPLDSCDNIWTLTSTNSGTTWTPKEIEIDGVKGEVANLPNFAPIVRYMGQVDAAVTNKGVVHAVAAGFGENFGTVDTTWMFPIIYYNSASNTWKAISLPAIDTIQNLINWGAGRHNGNSYPSVSVSEDGQVVYVCWTGPQMTGNKPDTASDAGVVCNWRDLYHCWSFDGGKTFSTPVTLSSEKTLSEEYAQAPQLLRFDAAKGQYVADIVYLAHLGSGSFIQGGTTEYDDPIMYGAFPIIASGVNDGNQVVRSFSLEQNYPNPFNPSTKISYTLPSNSNVSLKVYDMLGREVANLVNGTQQAGQHNVNFDASKLASGVYVYTLRSNSNVMSKKMLLMK